MSWKPGGVGGFSDYSDFGSELDSSSFRIEDHWLDENGFHLRVPGYEGHRYSLQRSEDLKDGSWIRSGNQLTGSGRIGAPVPITLSWPATSSRMFFRVELDGAE